MLRHPGLAFCFLAMLVCNSQSSAQSTDENDRGSSPALTVMSFNIRYGTADDGNNHWNKRKELCAARVIEFAPDILGLQEALDFQNAYLLKTCPGYTAVGVARDDGIKKGEFSTLLLRTTRFKLLNSGTFWLSETPNVPGSKSWDSSLPRIATWAHVQDRLAQDRPLLIVNTHFDHRGTQARIESARIIRSFIIKHAADAPAIITGDFNSAPDSKPHPTLMDEGSDYGGMRDAYADIYRDKPETNTATFHGYQDQPTSARIDWILHAPAWRATRAAIDRYRVGPLFPSDHFAVIATLEWQ